MTQAEVIEAVLQAPPERLAAIVKLARGEDKPKPGTIRQAMDILECCDVTIRQYAKRGLLHPIRITPRKVRYDLNEVERLAQRGADAVAGGR